jgi:hypothetical protein
VELSAAKFPAQQQSLADVGNVHHTQTLMWRAQDRQSAASTVARYVGSDLRHRVRTAGFTRLNVCTS